MSQILSMEGKGNERASRQSMFTSIWNWFSSLHRFDKLFIVAALLIVVATPFIVSNNQNFNPEAARGGGVGHTGGGGKGGKTACSTCVLTVIPNQVPLGSPSVTISGSGFPANKGLVINTSMFPQPWITTDANGSFSILYSPSGTFWAPGPATVQALDASTMAVLATASYTVCSTNPCSTSTTPSPTGINVTVLPNPVPLNSTGITIGGLGFGANQEVLLDVSGWIPAPTVTADGNGSFSLFYPHTYTGGGNSFVKAYVNGTLVFTAPYSVCSTNPCQ